MKRSELVRRTPLRAKAGLKSSSNLTRRKAQSAKRVKNTGPKRSVVELVYARDGGCCIRCGKAVRRADRGVSFSVQHRKARGRGGSRSPELNLPSNLVILCGSATSAGGCHERAESHRSEARLSGLSVPSWAEAAGVPVSTWWGPVLLDDKGRWHKVEQPEGCGCDPVLCVTSPDHCEQEGCVVCEGRWTEVHDA